MNYHEIKTDNELNGENLRTVLWISGCTLGCKNCFNPQTWDFNSGKPFTKEVLQELLDIMDKPYIDGLTISGGNPLELRNIVDVNIITSAVRTRFGNTKTIWMYTGYTWDEVMRFTDPTNFPILSIDYKIVLNAIDVLVDGRYVDELNDVKYPYAGSTNQRVIDVQQSLKAGIPILFKER